MCGRNFRIRRVRRHRGFMASVLVDYPLYEVASLGVSEASRRRNREIMGSLGHLDRAMLGASSRATMKQVGRWSSGQTRPATADTFPCVECRLVRRGAGAGVARVCRSSCSVRQVGPKCSISLQLVDVGHSVESGGCTVRLAGVSTGAVGPTIYSSPMLATTRGSASWRPDLGPDEGLVRARTIETAKTGPRATRRFLPRSDVQSRTGGRGSPLAPRCVILHIFTPRSFCFKHVIRPRPSHEPLYTPSGHSVRPVYAKYEFLISACGRVCESSF